MAHEEFAAQNEVLPGLHREIHLRKSAGKDISRFCIFNAWDFLAHYVAMCPSDAPINNTKPVEPAAAHSPNEQPPVASQLSSVVSMVSAPVEIGGRDGLEPTRFGDWEKAGRCIDF